MKIDKRQPSGCLLLLYRRLPRCDSFTPQPARAVALTRFASSNLVICSITEKEIRDNMDEGDEEMADSIGMTKEKCYEKLKKQYDGYHFSKSEVRIYNPFSLSRAIDSQDFGDYWFEMGTPTFLVETMKRNNYDLEQLTSENVTADLLGSLDSININPIPLIYQSGYLTIKSFDPRSMTYRLGFPNEEVERGFTRFLLRLPTPHASSTKSA